MTDTIIKGTGNSRTLRTVPNAMTLYPDFPAVMQALIDGTFPIDIGPLNPAGVDVHGTDLRKANLLKDTTAALYGLTAQAVPDDVLAALRPLITKAQNTADNALSSANSRSRLSYGTFVGDGARSKTIYCSYPWRIFFVSFSDGTSVATESTGIILRDMPIGAAINSSGAFVGYYTSATDNSVIISGGAGFNASGVKHTYVAIGT